MKFCIIFLSLIISTFYNEVSGLNFEGIVHGYWVYEHDFKYEAPILGKPSYSDNNVLLCNGGIITNEHIISAAHCFLEYPGLLKNLSFFIVVGAINLQLPIGYKVNIELIYMPDYDEEFSWNDIAIAKLNTSLDIDNNSDFLKKLELPNPLEKFYGKIGTISGYGAKSSAVIFNPIHATLERTNQTSNLTLTAARVKIIDQESCQKRYSHINIAKQLCGFVIPNILDKPAGLCSGDSGSPLVYDNKIMGIASRSPIDCNDSSHGSIYTNVSEYMDFILHVLQGIAIDDFIYIYHNPAYSAEHLLI